MDDAERYLTSTAKTVARINDRLEAIADRLKRLLNRDPNEPNDPYSYVGAPLKPKPPRLKSSVRLPLR